MPQPQPEVEKLLREIDRIRRRYSRSTDPRIKKVVRELTRIKHKIESSSYTSKPGEVLDIGFKLLVIADKMNDWFKDL